LGIADAIVLPYAAAAHRDGDWSEQRFELRARGFGILVAFDRQRQALSDVYYARVVFVGECCQRRTEHDGFRKLCSPARVLLDRIEEKLEIAGDHWHRRDAEFFVLAFKEGAQRNEAGTGVPENRIDINFDLIAIGLQYLPAHHVLPPIWM